MITTHGLRANRGQLALLVLVNICVGGMVGLERTLVPLVAAVEFRLEPGVAAFTFIIAFGIVKACTNLAAGALVGPMTRRQLLIAGWAAGLPVPFMLAWGDRWLWIIAANVLLGVSQGLTWSMTLMMKVDLAGPRRRGIAVSLNETAGYGALGVTAWLTGYIASAHGLRPAPFLLGVAYATAGFVLSAWLVRDTSAHAQLESDSTDDPSGAAAPPTAPLGSLSQAGLVTNLNDATAWAIFPLLYAAQGLAVDEIGVIKAAYPVTWAAAQLATGPLSDRVSRKPLIVAGMLVQAAAHAVIGFGITHPRASGVIGAVMLGLGTAMVYPTLVAAVGDAVAPRARPRALGVYRFWRDSGYAVGALLCGLAAARAGLVWTVHLSGAITLASGLAVWRLMSPEPGNVRANTASIARHAEP